MPETLEELLTQCLLCSGNEWDKGIGLSPSGLSLIAQNVPVDKVSSRWYWKREIPNYPGDLAPYTTKNL